MAFTSKIADLIAADTTGLLAKHDSWERVSLAEVAFILNGAPFDSAMFSNTQGFPLVRIRDVLEGATSTYYTGDYEENYVVAKGDLLIGMDGDFHCAFWKSSRALLNQRVCKVTVNEKFYLTSFLAHALPGYLAVINAHTPSITVKHLSSKTIAEIDLPLPPFAEQTRIVDKLEELLSDLDAGIAELKAAQNKLAQYRQSLLKAAVEGRLTEAWRAQHGEPEESGAQLLARILCECRAQWEAKQLAKFEAQCKVPAIGWENKYPEPLAPVDTALGVLPAGWTWATVDQLADVGTGVTPLRSKPQYFVNGTVPWVTSGALNDEIVKAAKEHVTDLALKECRLNVYPAGSLLVAMYGEGKTRGKCAELAFPATINQAIACLVFESPSDTCKSFVKLFLQKSYESMREQASGGVQPNLNLQIVKSIVLPLPPLSEQAKIANSITRYFEQLHQQAEAIRHALRQAAAQRKNILQAAFSGQLVPQDPNDEPAGVLLARIRAERAASGTPTRARGRKKKETL